jgi:ABC-type transport system substrate-binding protein
MARNVSTIDMDIRRQTWREIQDIVNDECFFIWLPTLKAKVPVRNRFGNIRPTVVPHRINRNIEIAYVTSRKGA